MRSSSWRFGIRCLVGFSTAATIAAAEPELPEARAHLERGMRHYEAQDYERAVSEFRAGYTLEPHRHFLYAIGQAERMRGNCERAIAAYNSFLRTNPPTSEAERASQNIERCEASLAQTPPPEPEPEAKPAPTAPSEVARDDATSTSSAPPTLAYVAFGIGGAGIVVGAVTGVLAISRERSARDQCDGDVCAPGAQEDIDATRRLAWTSNVAFGVGIVGLSVGLISWLTAGSEPAPATAVRADVTPVPGGFTTTVGGRF